MITRRSLLTGLAATMLIVPATSKIVRAAEVIEPLPENGHLWTSSWLEEMERGFWRQKSYRFKSATAPKILVVNAAPDAGKIAGVQLDYEPLIDLAAKARGSTLTLLHPPVTDAAGWIRGAVDVTNKDGVEIELSTDEVLDLLARQHKTHTIVNAPLTDLFCLADGEGSFVID